MKRRAHEVGMARAMWLQQEKQRQRPVVARPTLSLLQPPPIEAHVVPALGERYRDFVIIQAAVTTGHREWIVAHPPTGKQGRVVLDLITAHTLPYSDFGKWFCLHARAVADAILDTVNTRTM